MKFIVLEIVLVIALASYSAAQGCTNQVTTCKPDWVWSPTLCKCVCKYQPLNFNCPGTYRLNSAGECCTCMDTSWCTTGYSWNKEKCDCVCRVNPINGKCIAPWMLDFQGKCCVCGIRTCPKRQTLDALNCKCVDF